MGIQIKETLSLMIVHNGKIETEILWIVAGITKVEIIPIFSLTTQLSAEILMEMDMEIIRPAIMVMRFNLSRLNGVILTVMVLEIITKLVQ